MNAQVKRRKFLKNLSCMAVTIPGLPFVAHLFEPNYGHSKETSHIYNPASSYQNSRKLGIALVGLGNYSTSQLAPALQETQQCRLSGIVTGTPEKAEKWKRQYSIPQKNIYNYENFDSIKDNPDIDIVYVVLPNSMHAEYTIRAAEAGKHVICEKPMATSVEDCQRMIDACEQNNVKLSIGYRLHFEPHNQRVMELGQQEIYGKLKKVSGEHSAVQNDPGVWILDKELSGGGPLMDIGIYVVQGAVYSVGENPTTISARFGEITKPEIFKEVEQSIHWTMEFPGGITAECSSSYAKEGNSLEGQAENGWWTLEPAYSYSNIQGNTSEGKMDYPEVNQQALQMDAFADCIINGKKSSVPGEMGLRDVEIMMAIYEAAESGEKVVLDGLSVMEKK